MKKNTLPVALVAILFVSAMCTIALSMRFAWAVRTLGNLQVQFNVANRDRNLVNALVNEAYEYSKRNPAINPILESVGVNTKPASPTAPPRPGAK